jgi:hypothetical protein
MSSAIPAVARTLAKLTAIKVRKLGRKRRRMWASMIAARGKPYPAFGSA